MEGTVEELRTEFTQQYAKWLGEIDTKCMIVVTIATIVSALSGKIVVDVIDSKVVTNYEWLMTLPALLSFVASILSMIYAIRAFSSRHTSGPKGTKTVIIRIKQYFGLLFTSFEQYVALPQDPINDYNNALLKTDQEKSDLHSHFFQSRYGTTDLDIIANMRMLELRATNYSKLYAERIASSLLILGIVMILLWLTIKFQIRVCGYVYK